MRTDRPHAGLSEQAEAPSSSDANRPQRTTAFREWLNEVLRHDRRSLNTIEQQAGIRGNALGKFLRGERGGVQGLTPLMVRRIAPVLLLNESELLFRAGHSSTEPSTVSVVDAVARDVSLDPDEKAVFLFLYGRMVRDRGALSTADGVGARPGSR
jgi:hypothetical protein